MEPIDQVDTRSFLFRGADSARQPRNTPIQADVRRPPDRVELSAPFLRGGLIDHIRNEIDAGTYDNDRRISAAADAMMRTVFDR